MIDLTDAWLEWRETCELDKCSDEHIHQLCICSNQMYRRALQQLPDGTDCIERLASVASEDGEGEEYAKRHTFHLMECELLPAGEKAERQKYKDHIFSRVPKAGLVTGYFLRAFFRSWVKRKHNITYLMPTGNADGETAELQEIREHQALVEYSGTPDITPDHQADEEQNYKIAGEFWNGLTEIQRTALYVYHNHIPICDPALLAKLHVKREAFRLTPERILKSLVEFAAQKYSMTDPSDVLLLLPALEKYYMDWGKKSEIGKWITANTVIPEEYGMKVRFK